MTSSEKYVESKICLIFPQKVLNGSTATLPSFFQIKMVFNGLNYQTMKHSSLELIIIAIYCFLEIHSWLAEAQKITPAIQE